MAMRHKIYLLVVPSVDLFLEVEYNGILQDGSKSVFHDGSVLNPGLDQVSTVDFVLLVANSSVQ